MPQLDYFDQLYANNPDPWHYQTRWYEHRKRAISLGVLPQANYPTAIELGCSNGVFSESLAERCKYLLCLDGNDTAVNLAKQRLKNLAQIEVKQAMIPQDLPKQTFDLIVIGEMLYYLSHTDIQAVIHWVKTQLNPQGTLLCCHWRYPIDGFGENGETVHRLLRQQFSETGGFFNQVSLNDRDFLLDVWQKNSDSVAQQEGLI